MQIALTTLPSFAEADINTLAMETTRLQVAGIETFSSNTVDKAKECMAVASTESMVDTTVDKVMEKLRNIFFHTSTDKTGVMTRQILLDIRCVGVREEAEATFTTSVGAIQEIPGVFNQKESAGPVKVRTTFISTAPSFLSSLR